MFGWWTCVEASPVSKLRGSNKASNYQQIICPAGSQTIMCRAFDQLGLNFSLLCHYSGWGTGFGFSTWNVTYVNSIEARVYVYAFRNTCCGNSDVLQSQMWPFAQTSWSAYVCGLDISHSRFKQIKVNLVCLFKSYAPYFAMQGSCFRKQELIWFVKGQGNWCEPLGDLRGTHFSPLRTNWV
jgi:hypothetical protein